MSTPGMVPMIFRDGTYGDIPPDRVAEAMRDGNQRAAVMQFKDGTTGYIPLSRFREAVSSGDAKPISEVPTQFEQDRSGREGVIGSIIGATGQLAKGIVASATPLGNAVNTIQNARTQYQSIRDTGQTLQQRQNEQRIAAGYNPAYRAMAPAAEQFGVDVSGMEQAAQRGDTGGVIGRAVVPAAAAVAPLAIEGISNVPGVKSAAQELAARAKPGPVTPRLGDLADVANMPAKAISGAEDVFRAAAPTATKAGFRDNVYAAAGDLADIARKVDISENRGGVIRPDLRVRATSQAIGEHLEQMYQQERAPQVQSIADKPVPVSVKDANVSRGLEYMEATAGDLNDAAIATKALNGGSLSASEADRLAIVTNQALKTFERMAPDKKVQAQMTNPKIGGLKALDQDLSRNLNGALKDNGQPGLYSYERRYAALADIKAQLDSRMNAVELDQPGMIKGVIRPIGQAMTGKAGIASASQAAVADVNIGRRLQVGLKKLADSGITARRETPDPITAQLASDERMVTHNGAQYRVRLNEPVAISAQPKEIPFSSIRATNAALERATARSEAFPSNADYPPVTVEVDASGNYWLRDGHHRYAAMLRNPPKTVMAYIQLSPEESYSLRPKR